MIQGERVRLRALEPSDVDTIWGWHQDHEFHVLDGWVYPSPRSQIAELVERVSAPAYSGVWLGIETRTETGTGTMAETGTGTLIGYTNLKRASEEHRTADFGIAIGRDHWDGGYGTDATRTMLRFGFTQMNLHRVALGVMDDNARAQRVYEKCGFQVEGRERESKFRDGRWHDMVRMSILASEFAALEAEPRTE